MAGKGFLSMIGVSHWVVHPHSPLLTLIQRIFPTLMTGPQIEQAPKSSGILTEGNSYAPHIRHHKGLQWETKQGGTNSVDPQFGGQHTHIGSSTQGIDRWYLSGYCHHSLPFCCPFSFLLPEVEWWRFIEIKIVGIWDWMHVSISFESFSAVVTYSKQRLALFSTLPSPGGE